MAKILITGGFGFIGWKLSNCFLANSDEVVIYDSFMSYVSPLGGKRDLYQKYVNHRLKDLEGRVELIQGDIRDSIRLKHAVETVKPDVVVHLAALPIADVSNKFSYEAITVNLNGTMNILEALRSVKPIPKLVYASSSMVYGNFQKEPAAEDHPTRPIEVYGGTKLAAEVMIKAYSDKFGIQYNIIRPSAVYGPTDCNQRVTQIFVHNALCGNPIKVNNPTERLDFTYVEDTAQGFYLAATKPVQGETFNITRGEGRSLLEFAKIVQSHIPAAEIQVSELKTDRPMRGKMDISKARNMLGYAPKVSIEEGVAKYISFAKGFFEK